MFSIARMQEAKRAVITVGNGRGFIVDQPDRHLIITAAHCLPYLPPCNAASYLEQRTYRALLGPIERKPTVWAECLFADPISDIAALCSPDEELNEQADAFRALLKGCDPLPVSDAAKSDVTLSDEPEWRPGWLLSLDVEWFPCEVSHLHDGPLSIRNAVRGIFPGMSGSPILDDNGSAIGVVCLNTEGQTTSDMNPRLAFNLPVGLWQNMSDLLREREAPFE